ncbi:hypothetical protein Slin14017_G058320 [Septoria linicola]|nr:hypothetical protein Slin14017_G058320 [Septoria linicola]
MIAALRDVVYVLFNAFVAKNTFTSARMFLLLAPKTVLQLCFSIMLSLGTLMSIRNIVESYHLFRICDSINAASDKKDSAAKKEMQVYLDEPAAVRMGKLLAIAGFGTARPTGLAAPTHVARRARDAGPVQRQFMAPPAYDEATRGGIELPTVKGGHLVG